MTRTRKKKRLRVIDLMIIVVIIVVGVIAVTKISGKIRNTKETGKENIVTIQQQESQVEEKYVKILEDGSKLNISEKLKTEKKLENIVIKDIQLMYKDGVTNILANVENTGSTKLEATKLEITLLDDKGETVYKMQGLIEETEAGATSKLNSSITADFANVYDFVVSKK